MYTILSWPKVEKIQMCESTTVEDVLSDLKHSEAKVKTPI